MLNGTNMDDTSPEREGTRRGRNGATEESKLDGKRSGDASQRKSIHTSIAESATVTISEDSQGTTKEGHEGIEEPQAPGDGNNKRDMSRLREAKGNEEPSPPVPPAGTNDEESNDQEMADGGNNNTGEGEEKGKGSEENGREESNGPPNGREGNIMNGGTGGLTAENFKILLQ